MNKQEKIKSSVNTLFWQYIFVAISTLMPFVIRTLIIRFWGMDYLGLNSLFSSVIKVLNLSELGIGSALIISMYKPVAEGDIERTNQLLSLYAFFYKILGMIILVVGCCIAPFITKFIKGSYPSDINIYIVYLIYLLQTVASYWAYAYAVAAFHVNQKLGEYIKVTAFVWILCYIMQIVVIILCKNYYLYAALLVGGTMSVGIITRIKMHRMYPIYTVTKIQYEWFDKLFWEDFWKRVSAMVLSKIRVVLRESIDSIIISSVLGLVLVAKYQNYILVMSVPYILCSSIVGAVLPGLGNGIATNDVGSNYGTVKIVSFVNRWATTLFAAFLLCLFQPFISVWAGEENTLSYACVLLFCIYFYLKCLSEIPQLVRNSTGIWWEGKWVAIAESLVNLALNIVFVNIWGIEGIILATVISIGVINIPFETYYVYKYYFKINPVKDLIMELLEFLGSALIVGITYYICQMYNGDWIGTFIHYGIICLIVPNVLFVAFHFKSKELKEIFTIGLMFIKFMHKNLLLENLLKIIYRVGRLLMLIGQKGFEIVCHYSFVDRIKGSDSLLIIVAGYQDCLWNTVFGRVKKYVPEKFDVCVVVPGQKNKEILQKLSSFCSENNWSLLITAENKLALAQNKAIELHDKAENIFKIDEDIFIGKNYFEGLLNTYEESCAKEECKVGFVAPTLNVNGASYYKVLDFFNARDEYKEKFGEITSACVGIPAWYSGDAAEFIWNLTLPLNKTVKMFYDNNDGYYICSHRFSIGAIFLKRAFWTKMGGFRVAYEGTLGYEESEMCKFCMDESYLIVISNKVLAGHLGFGPQKEKMMEYFKENIDRF